MYKYYLSKGGGKLFWLIIILILLVVIIARGGSGFWLVVWLQDELKQTVSFYLGIYALFTFSDVIINVIFSALFIGFGIRASIRLHQAFIERIAGAPTSFFDTTPLGRILNRFTKDMDLVDLQLAFQFNILIRNVCFIFTIFVVMVYASRWLLIPIPILVIAYYLLQGFFRHLNRESQRNNSVSLSPIFSHFSETLGGLDSVR